MRNHFPLFAHYLTGNTEERNKQFKTIHQLQDWNH